MSLAYAECPLDVRESLAAQYFIDTIKDENTQCCWKEEHSSAKLERDLLEVQQEGARAEGVPGDYFEPGKLTHGCLAGRRLPSLNRAPEEGPRVSSLSGK
ncbi:hypothetical protein AVEN_20220-1 [Araneus ventricosus]|uniref:Uncharacterized protein n=1 Tax=Araneus ventricosus TaxID=182803 RepID=A0A4Y2CK32_ARAVE|nr:hypothetical protein AVEN_20220-1 [Araneus ventricosus]